MIGRQKGKLVSVVSKGNKRWHITALLDDEHTVSSYPAPLGASNIGSRLQYLINRFGPSNASDEFPKELYLIEVIVEYDGGKILFIDLTGPSREWTKYGV